MNQQINITKEDALVLKGLIERHEAAKQAIMVAQQVQNVSAMERAGLAYEDSCMDIWSFNLAHGIPLKVNVVLPYVV